MGSWHSRDSAHRSRMGRGRGAGLGGGGASTTTRVCTPLLFDIVLRIVSMSMAASMAVVALVRGRPHCSTGMPLRRGGDERRGVGWESAGAVYVLDEDGSDGPVVERASAERAGKSVSCDDG